MMLGSSLFPLLQPLTAWLPTDLPPFFHYKSREGGCVRHCAGSLLAQLLLCLVGFWIPIQIPITIPSRIPTKHQEFSSCLLSVCSILDLHTSGFDRLDAIPQVSLDYHTIRDYIKNSRATHSLYIHYYFYIPLA